MSIQHVDAVALSTDFEIGKRNVPVFELSENLAGFRLDLLFFVRNVRNDVVDDVEAGHARISRTGERLHCNDVNLLNAKGRLEWRQSQDKRHRRAIRIGNDIAALVALIFLLHWKQGEMLRIDLWHE